jgi:hypothetical protein
MPARTTAIFGTLIGAGTSASARSRPTIASCARILCNGSNPIGRGAQHLALIGMHLEGLGRDRLGIGLAQLDNQPYGAFGLYCFG